MVRGYYRRLEDERWEPVRWLGTLLANINRGPDDAAYEPTDLLPLRKDPPPPLPPPPATPEQTAALLAELDALDNDLLTA